MLVALRLRVVHGALPKAVAVMLARFALLRFAVYDLALARVLARRPAGRLVAPGVAKEYKVLVRLVLPKTLRLVTPLRPTIRVAKAKKEEAEGLLLVARLAVAA